MKETKQKPTSKEVKSETGESTKWDMDYDDVKVRIYMLMDEYGAETTISAAVDLLVETIGDENLSMGKRNLIGRLCLRFLEDVLETNKERGETLPPEYRDILDELEFDLHDERTERELQAMTNGERNFPKP